MPTTASWSQGPMGPGFFILFPSHVTALTPTPTDAPTGSRGGGARQRVSVTQVIFPKVEEVIRPFEDGHVKEDVEVLALLMLMGNRE